MSHCIRIWNVAASPTPQLSAYSQDRSHEHQGAVIGTGSGDQAAVLSLLAAHVSSIEIVKPLATAAATRLCKLRYRNVVIRAGDGYAGWGERAPFDGIIVVQVLRQCPSLFSSNSSPAGGL